MPLLLKLLAAILMDRAKCNSPFRAILNCLFRMESTLLSREALIDDFRIRVYPQVCYNAPISSWSRILKV